MGALSVKSNPNLSSAVDFALHIESYTGWLSSMLELHMHTGNSTAS